MILLMKLLTFLIFTKLEKRVQGAIKAAFTKRNMKL